MKTSKVSLDAKRSKRTPRSLGVANNKILLMLVLGSMSVGSTFTMYMGKPSALSLRQWLDGEICSRASNIAISNSIARPLDVEFQNAKPGNARILAELRMHYGRYKVEIAQLNFDCVKRISDRLDADLPSMNSEYSRIRERTRVAFNECADEEMQETCAEVGRLQNLCQRLKAARTGNNAQALLAEIRPQPPLGNNNNPDSTVKNFFCANNRKYITGVAISAAVAGTIYFYGHRIKAWITGKPVQEHATKAPRK